MKNKVYNWLYKSLKLWINSKWFGSGINGFEIILNRLEVVFKLKGYMTQNYIFV